jgi:hypothetical protein
MKVYEVPMLIDVGSFRKSTGLMQRAGNEFLLFSKN